MNLRSIRSRFWIITGIGLALGALLLVLLLRGGIFQAPDRTWQAIQTQGTWRVGMDPSFPPFETLDDEGRMVGFDVDLARAIAAEWGVEVDLIAIGFDGLTDALHVGRVDSVISALPYDPRLTRDLRYTDPYFEAGTRLVVVDDASITSVDDLAGRTVAVEWGSAGDAALRRLQQEDATIERIPLPSPDEALAALLRGDADALLVDGVTLRLAQGQDADIVAVGPPLEGDPYVIAVPIGAPVLQEELNRILQQFRDDGTLAALEERWFAP